MAIAFARVSIHSRSKGHSAIAASAYRSASKLFDERTGINYDYSNRSDVVFSEILLPAIANSNLQNRELLWNEVERVENRVNSQLCKDVVLALPRELSREQQIELARRFAQTYFLKNNIPCDVAIHDGQDGNPHAHLLVTLRRLEKDGFAKYKARDLNPSFYKGNIVEGEYWGEQWREFQNDFFQEHALDLKVDLNHFISEKHTGKVRSSSSHYLHDENALIKEARTEIALNDIDFVLQQISSTHSVFTRKDIEKLLLKTLSSKENASYGFTRSEEILSHKKVIHLGPNDQGIECYTTRNQYVAESFLLKTVEQLQSRKNHVYTQSLTSFIQHYDLNEEQSEAFSFITQGEDISVLIGRPGVGKSYLLKPLKEFYRANECRVIGTSLSAKVAKALQAETGIPSSTIASLSYRLRNNKFKMTSNDVLIIDEAGMVDFNNMAYLIGEVKKAGAKVILVGDPDQLKPIHKGEIFRGIAAHTGYIELDNIRRQHNKCDRQASLNLAQGQIDKALTHYFNQRNIHFSENISQCTEQLVINWLTSLKSCDIKQHIMLAFTRKAVWDLNQQARNGLQKRNQLSNDEYSYYSENGKREINLALHERILFRQNNKGISVRNGDLATITAINNKQFTAILDSGEQVIIPRDYKHIDYGYALTVHKAQGMTIDSASVLIDSKYWDRFLSFVAFTRHRKSLNIYADRVQHPDIKSLCNTLSRSSTKDNVIDWPLDFAIRAGFDPDKMLGRALNRIAGIGHQIKNKWNYLVNYENYLKVQIIEERTTERKTIRTAAKEIANYLDEKNQLGREIEFLHKAAKNQGTDISQVDGFESIYERTLLRDKQASKIEKKYSSQFKNLDTLKLTISSIIKDANRFREYQTLKSLVESNGLQTNEMELNQLTKIDLKKNYIHIKQLSAKMNKEPSSVFQFLLSKQKRQERIILNDLIKDNPLLAEYDRLNKLRSTSKGFKAEQIDRKISKTSLEIVQDKNLNNKIKMTLPNLLAAINDKAHYKEIRKNIELYGF